MVVWSTIEASCPICKNRLRLREVGSGFALGQDSDLFVRMKGKHIIQAEVHTCHQCRYSGFSRDFFRDVSAEERLCFLKDVAPQLVDEDEERSEDRTPRKLATGKSATKRRAESADAGKPAVVDGTKHDQRRTARKSRVQKRSLEDAESPSTSKADDPKRGLKKSRKVAKRRKVPPRSRHSEPPLPLHPCKRTPMPHIQYYWAAKTAEALGFCSRDQAERVLRAYWCLRISPSSKLPARTLKRLRKRYLTEAIRKFRQGLRHEKDPNIVYLVAELCRRNGNFLLAAGYFRRFFEKGPETCEYLRQASEKLYLVAKEKLPTELSMEEVLYNPAPEKDED